MKNQQTDKRLDQRAWLVRGGLLVAVLVASWHCYSAFHPNVPPSRIQVPASQMVTDLVQQPNAPTTLPEAADETRTNRLPAPSATTKFQAVANTPAKDSPSDDIPNFDLAQSAISEKSPGDTIVNSIGMKLAYIPAGEFLMGSPELERGHHQNEKQHHVRISKPFYLGVFVVTQEEYKKVIGENPSYFAASGAGKEKVKGVDTGRFPVEQVSWDDANKFCGLLSKKESKIYRLPTEAEWEYACRAGTTTKFAFGNSLSSRQANFYGSSAYDGAAVGPDLGRTTRVDAYKPNAWGLYDMHGNVWQWCLDNYRIYSESPLANPTALSDAATLLRVIRGSGWNTYALDCRSACRTSLSHADKKSMIGFRIVLGAVPDDVKPMEQHAQEVATARKDLKSSELRTRQSAASKLARFGEESAAAIDDLISCLDEVDGYTQQQICEALGNIPSAAAKSVPALEAQYKKVSRGTGPEDCLRAIASLAAHSDLPIPFLVEVATKPRPTYHPPSLAQEIAFGGLAHVKIIPAKYLDGLLTIAIDPKESAHNLALPMLGKVEGIAENKLAIKKLTNFRDSQKSVLADTVLRRVQAPPDEMLAAKLGPKLDGSAQVEAARKSLKSPEPRNRTQAAVKLASLGDKSVSAVDDLISCLGEMDDSTHSAICIALGRIPSGAAKSFPALESLFRRLPPGSKRSNCLKAIASLAANSDLPIPLLVEVAIRAPPKSLPRALEEDIALGGLAQVRVIPAKYLDGLLGIATDQKNGTHNLALPLLENIEGIAENKLAIKKLKDFRDSHRSVVADAVLRQIQKKAEDKPGNVLQFGQ